MNEKELRLLKNDQLIEIKENILNGEKNMANEDRITRLEASVSKLIQAFQAAEEQAEEEVKLKAEEEEKLQAEEEEEAKKMIPVSKVVAEEEEAEPKEEKDEDEDEKVEKLEKEVAQLASLIKKSFSASKGKITPGTPEDEPAMTTHKIPKISNEPVPSKKVKEGEKLFQTPAMKPGKLKAAAGRDYGEASAFTGAVAPLSTEDRKIVEQKALDEVFGFAASRGVKPIDIDYRVKTLRM